MESQRGLKSWRTPAAVACLFLVACWYVVRLDAKSFWVDEIWSIEYSRRPLSEIANCPDPIHGPVYYAALHLWTGAFGESEFAMRSMSVAFSLLALAALILFVRQLFGGKTALVAAMLFALAPVVYHYSREARQYSLLLFLVIASTHLLYRRVSMGGKVSAMGYVGVSTLALLTHYAFLFVIPAHLAIAFLLSGRRLRWETILPLAAPLLLGVCAVLFWDGLARGIVVNLRATFSPASFVFPLRAAGKIAYTFYVFCLGETVLPLTPLVIAPPAIFAGLLIAGLRDLFRNDRTQFWCMTIMGLLPILSMSLMTQRASPRYLVFCVLPFFIVVAKGWLTASVAARVVGAVIALGGFGYSLVNYHCNEQFHNLAYVEPSREVAHEIVKRLSEEKGGGNIVYAEAHKPLGYYLRKAGVVPLVRFVDHASSLDDALRSVEDRARDGAMVVFIRTSPGQDYRAGKWARFDEELELALMRDSSLRVVDIRRACYDPYWETKEKFIDKPFMTYRLNILYLLARD